VGWHKSHASDLQKSELQLEELSFPLVVSCNNNDIFTNALTKDRKKPALGFYLMVLTLPDYTTGWETFPCPMRFDNIAYSWIITGLENKQNEEFSLALETIIESIYKKSYVFKYYNVFVGSDNGVVNFYNPSKKRIHTTDRFTVKLRIPEKTKIYFKPSTFWDTLNPEWPEWFPAQKLSGQENGTLVHTPGSKNHLYIPPFSVSFRSQGIEQNYLGFNRFHTPNLEGTILCMLLYDSLNNTLFPFFDPYLFIPYTNDMSLTQDLEFKILDSDGRHVHISNNSQLFFVLTLL
jgi:hypothetical protein